MARLAAGQKAAQQVALTRARAALKASGASEITSGAAKKHTTASAKAVHHAHGAGVYVKKLKLRKIRLRGSKPSSY